MTLALPPAREPTWRSVDGLVHVVHSFMDSTVSGLCMIAQPWPLSNLNRRWAYVYGTRSSSYLPDEIGDTDNQPVTCLWCLTGKWRE